MKKFNQNKIRANRVSKSNTQTLFLSKATRKHNTLAIAAIFFLIVLHFVSQFTFFKADNFKVENPQAEKPFLAIEKAENEQIAEIKIRDEAKNPDIAATANPTTTVVQPKPKITPPARIMIKKKEPRESRAERLRRAERILTGV